MRAAAAAAWLAANELWRNKAELRRFLYSNWVSNVVFFAILIGSVEALGLHYLWGAFLAFLGYTVCQFFLMRWFVYENTDPLWGRIWRYFLLQGKSQVVNMTCLWLLTDGLWLMVGSVIGWYYAGFHYLVSQILADGVSLLINRYGSNRIFREECG